MAANPQTNGKSPRKPHVRNDEEVIEEIIELLSEGESMRKICERPGMPNRRSIERWMTENPKLAADIARARAIGYDQRAEKAVEEAKQAEDPAAGRLAFDAERWYLSKMKPKVYGDSTMLKHANADGETLRSAIDPTLLSPDERDTLRQLILASQQRALAPPEEAEYEEIGDEEE